MDTLAAYVAFLGYKVAAVEASIQALSAEVQVGDKFSKESVAYLLETTTTLGLTFGELLSSPPQGGGVLPRFAAGASEVVAFETWKKLGNSIA